jgi:mono/diheme cytochrome c family protein
MPFGFTELVFVPDYWNPPAVLPPWGGPYGFDIESFTFAFGIGAALGQIEDKVYAIWGDPRRGQKVYAAKACGRCHAINGVGPTIGPDLALTPRTTQTVTQIAGAMWNHAPQMRKLAEETGVRWVPFKGSEMRDLIAFLYLLHFLDKPGDVRRGERLFVEKHCISCHSVDGKGQAIGPDLSRCRQYGSSIL